MNISNPFNSINAIVHRFNADVILRAKENSKNVFEFDKKSTKFSKMKYSDLEFCDAGTATELLQTSGIRVIVLNENKKVIGRNWI
jgi:hypothetical protein